MKKQRKWIIALIIIIILVGVLVASGFFILNHYYSKMETTDSLKPAEVGVTEDLVEKETESNIINIALLGLDLNGDGSEGRSDAMKVVSLDFNNKTLKMTSFQRDTLIYIPDPKNDFDKLNHAFAYGKAPLTLKTLNYNFDLDLTRYVAFNFDAIEHIIDLVGGVEMDINSAEVSVTNDYIDHLNSLHSDDKDASRLTTSGLQTLNGRQAMAYMRNRYVGSDFTRMERQSKIIEAMISKAATLSYTDLLSLLDSCLPYVETNLTMNEIISYGTQVLGFNLGNIQQIQIPASDNVNKSISYNGYNPLYIMSSYQDLVKELHAFIYGDTQYQPSQTVIDTEAAIYEKFGTVE